MDEGVRTLRDLSQIVRYEAAAMLCVKPARVGGLANARMLVAKAQRAGLRVYLGGFFESPYARRVNRTLANSCISEPSDLDDVAVRERSDRGGGDVDELWRRSRPRVVLAGSEALSVL